MISKGLAIQDLRAGVPGREILKGISLSVGPGEVVAVMGPNGSGKSTLSNVIMGRAAYTVTSGSIKLDGVELSELKTHERAKAGVFLISQYPEELPGVTIDELLEAALVSDGVRTGGLGAMIEDQASKVGFPERLRDRFVNVDLSGGEKKRAEVVQMGILNPRFAVLDEIDSGLDIDALRAVAKRVREIVAESGTGVLVITHYARLLRELEPDRVLVLQDGQIKDEGDLELAVNLERTGYAEYLDLDPSSKSGSLEDLFRI